MHTSFLRYMDEVARQRSIRKAASLLNVSSTSVNRKIINVERQLGVRLFERSPEGVELTGAGKILLEHARKTLFDYEQVRSVLEDIRDLRTGFLSVHTLDSVTFSVLPRVLEEFMERYPGISIAVATERPDEIVDSVARGEADVGITFTNDLHPDVRIYLEKAAPFGLIMRPDHPLAGRASVEVEDIVGYPLVRTIDARGGKSILDLEMAEISITLSTHIYTNALEIAKQAILSNRVAGIYTKIGFLKEIERGELTYVKLSHRNLRDYKIGLIVSATSSTDPVKHLFLGFVERLLKTMRFDA